MAGMNVLPSKPEIRRSLAEGLIVCPQFRRESGEALAFGQAVHTFIASYWRHLQAVRRDSDLIHVTRLASDAWARTPGLLQSRFDEFMELCRRFADVHLGDLVDVVAIEETLVHDRSFAVLNCTPDRIDRLAPADPDEDPTHLLIRDYKTEQGEMEHQFQVRWYTQQAFLRWPSVERIDFEIDPIRQRSGPYRFPFHDPDDGLPCERGELDQWWQTTLEGVRLRLLARGAAAAPVGGPACADCALRHRCAEAIMPAFLEPRSDEQADELLARHHRLAAAAEAVWGALELYYHRGRPARIVNGEEVGFLETREASWHWTARPSAIAAWAMRRRMSWRSFVGLTAKRLENKGLQEQAMADGLGERRFNPPIFKTRKAPTERRRKREQAAAGDGS